MSVPDTATTEATEQAPSTAKTPVLPEAKDLDDRLKESLRIGNGAMLVFMDHLRRMAQTRLYHALGYPSLVGYCERELGLGRTTVLEHLRVCKALDALPSTRAWFGAGELSLHQVQQISRVADSESEREWIKLAVDCPFEQLRAEVRDARVNKRSTPRKRGHGMRNITTTITLEFTLEQRERIRGSLELLRDNLNDVAGEYVGSDAAALYLALADGLLAGTIPCRPVATVPGRRSRSHKRRPAGNGGADEQTTGETDDPVTPEGGRPTPYQTVLYHSCPDCRRSSIITGEGPVAVSPERIEEIAPSARVITIRPEDEVTVEVRPAGRIDPPNSPRLTRQVLHRDRLECSNPGCRNRHNLQAHHVVFRSLGGPTLLDNEIAICDVCHTLIHSSRLDVTGSVENGLTWTPRPEDPEAQVRTTQRLQERLDSLVAMALPEKLRAQAMAAESGSADGPAGAPSGTADGESGNADTGVGERSGSADGRRDPTSNGASGSADTRVCGEAGSAVNGATRGRTESPEVWTGRLAHRPEVRTLGLAGSPEVRTSGLARRPEVRTWSPEVRTRDFALCPEVRTRGPADRPEVRTLHRHTGTLRRSTCLCSIFPATRKSCCERCNLRRGRAECFPVGQLMRWLSAPVLSSPPLVLAVLPYRPYG